MLEDEVVKKLRNLQANQIKDTSGAVSLSTVINEILKKNLRV